MCAAVSIIVSFECSGEMCVDFRQITNVCASVFRCRISRIRWLDFVRWNSIVMPDNFDDVQTLCVLNYNDIDDDDR